MAKAPPRGAAGGFLQHGGDQLVEQAERGLRADPQTLDAREGDGGRQVRAGGAAQPAGAFGGGVQAGAFPGWRAGRRRRRRGRHVPGGADRHDRLSGRAVAARMAVLFAIS
jgi:hypothetical protein